MQVSDKLIRPLTEAKYLNADNVSRYRCIMRIFFEHYEKLKYWLYQEEVYEEMIQDPFFADYRMEQCQQDLMMLTEWKNLNTIQDTKKVASIEEFKNKKYRYQMTEYSVEIRRITRYAAQLSEKNALGANRKEEYRKVAELFLRCQNVEEAHKMSALVFGMECPQHLAGELIRETDSMNIGVYEEQPMEITLKPRVRTYREKSRRSAIRESAEQKQETRRKLLEQQKKETEKLRALEVDGKIYFDKLPVLEPRIREILLKWLSDAMESADFAARTDDGRRYILDRSQAGENCVVHCEDGNFTMPKLAIVFQEEV